MIFSISLCGGGAWQKSGTSGKVCPGQILFCLRRNFSTQHWPRDNEGFSGEGGDAETIFAKIFTFSTQGLHQPLMQAYSAYDKVGE